MGALVAFATRIPRLVWPEALATAAFASALAFLPLNACVTATPPDLPEPPLRRPTILHSAVVPPEDQPLAEWPSDGQFLVPVEVDAPNVGFYYDVFIDFDPITGSGMVIAPQPVAPDPDKLDGGIQEVSFQIPTPPDPAFCHRVEFLVANAFNARSPHTPDSIGGDVATWWYTAGGGPDGCPSYDAGALEDGAFPSDAAADALPSVPTGAL